MKKIISILSVSLFAVVFAAGCGEGGGKVAKCEDAKKVKACKEGTKDNKKCVAQFTAAAENGDDKDVKACLESGDKVRDAIKTACEGTTQPAVTAGPTAAAELVASQKACGDVTKLFSADEDHKCVSTAVVGGTAAGKCTFQPKAP